MERAIEVYREWKSGRLREREGREKGGGGGILSLVVNSVLT